MSDLPKEELDKVFREGAEQYDFPFKPEAWEHMESLLDRDRRRRRLLWWWLGVLGLILGIGVGLYYFGKNDANSTDPEAILKHATTAPIVERKDVHPKTDSRPGQLGAQPVPDQIFSKDPLSDSLLVPQANSRKKTNSGTIFQTAAAASAIVQQIERGNESDEPQNRTLKDSSDIQTDNRPYQSALETETVPSKESFSIIPLPIYFKEIASLNGIAEKLPDSLKSPVLPEMGKAVGSKLIWGIMLAPEVVSVGWDDFSRLGLKTGLMAEYLYFKRLGFKVGMNYLIKSYLAGKGEYHPPYGFWTNKIAPIETDGVCHIIEIPIMLSYYTRGYDQSGLYGAFGASSYIMLNEKYEYYYDVPDADLIQNWGSKEPKEHWMSLLNFSLGYSGSLSQKLAYRAGIYGQTPLKGVGHGQVKLHSLGLNLNLIFKGK